MCEVQDGEVVTCCDLERAFQQPLPADQVKVARQFLLDPEFKLKLQRQRLKYVFDIGPNEMFPR